MKKISCAIATMFISLAIAPTTTAATGKITFNGVLRTGTCVVTPGSGTSGTTENMIVKLDTVWAAALSTPDSYAATKAFDINIGGDVGDTCNGHITKIIFENVGGTGSTINEDGYLDNSASGSATNVGVRLLNGNDHSVINLIDNTNAPTVTPQLGAPGVLKYQAQYYSKAGNATAGTVHSYLTYTVSY